MKRSRTTALLLMGTAPLLLTACDRGADTRVAQGLYTSVDSCVAATGDRAACSSAFEQARQHAADAAPQYASQQDCARDYPAEQCVTQHTSAGHSFVGPLMTGFLLSRMLDGNRAGLASASATPAYRDKDDRWGTTPGAGTGGLATASRIGSGRSALQPVSVSADRPVTVSRGGFGRSGGSRGFFGG